MVSFGGDQVPKFYLDDPPPQATKNLVTLVRAPLGPKFPKSIGRRRPPRPKVTIGKLGGVFSPDFPPFGNKESAGLKTLNLPCGSESFGAILQFLHLHVPFTFFWHLQFLRLCFSYRFMGLHCWAHVPGCLHTEGTLTWTLLNVGDLHLSRPWWPPFIFLRSWANGSVFKTLNLITQLLSQPQNPDQPAKPQTPSCFYEIAPPPHTLLWKTKPLIFAHRPKPSLRSGF